MCKMEHLLQVSEVAWLPESKKLGYLLKGKANDVLFSLLSSLQNIIFFKRIYYSASNF